jgi:hypothetical protein
MTHSAADAHRKPRRLGVYLPAAIALVLVIGWSLGWLWAIGEIGRRIDAGAAAVKAQGWQVSWSARRLSGYPYRLDADFTDFRVVDPSGWGVATSQLRSEAYLFAPGHWLIGTQQGLTLLRPDAGPVSIAAPLIRASISDWAGRPPQIAVVADQPVLTPAPGAAPFWLQRAQDVQLYTRPGPSDQGAADFVLHGAVVTPASTLGQIAGTGPLDLTFNPVFSHVSAFQGGGWRAGVLAWAHGGGTIEVNYFALASPSLKLASHAGTLAVGDDGQLAGAAQASIAKAEGSEDAPIAFTNGQAWLGGKPVASSPRAF